MTIPGILSFFTLFLSTGCTTTYYVPRDQGADEIVEARDRIEGSTGEVISIEGSDFRLDGLTLRGDTVSGYDRQTHSAVALPLSNLDEITATSVTRGLGLGVVRGIAIAGGFGLLAGTAFAADAGDYVVGVVRSGVIFGVIPGAICGALFLATDHFRFVEKGDSRIEGKTHPTPEGSYPK